MPDAIYSNLFEDGGADSFGVLPIHLRCDTTLRVVVRRHSVIYLLIYFSLDWEILSDTSNC